MRLPVLTSLVAIAVLSAFPPRILEVVAKGTERAVVERVSLGARWLFAELPPSGSEGAYARVMVDWERLTLTLGVALALVWAAWVSGRLLAPRLMISRRGLPEVFSAQLVREILSGKRVVEVRGRAYVVGKDALTALNTSTALVTNQDGSESSLKLAHAIPYPSYLVKLLNDQNA
jgi:hypothetical protein